MISVKDPYSIVKYPLLTERSTFLREEQQKYMFRVDKRANKIEIKQAVETIFPDVKVVSVNTITVHGKPKKTRYNKMKKTPEWKKAIVTLRPDDTIEIFGTI
jgi:large subunit ribosomal protein L23